MNNSTGYVINNHNLIDYIKKRDEISTKGYWRENNGLMDSVDIDYMSPASVFNQYVNMEYNNKHHNLHSNGNIQHQRTHKFQRWLHLLLYQ